MVAVEKLWPGETVCILANGPSLTAEDVARCRGLKTIAIKDAIRLAPWADVLYACDKKWWRAHPETASFAGLKFGLEAWALRPDVTVLRNTGMDGLELDPTGLRTGQNSGYQAINLAVHLGAKKIILLGYDMQGAKNGKHHWFGWHVYGQKLIPAYEIFLRLFPTIADPLQALGIEVVNATRESVLPCFPKVPLEMALA